MQVSPSTRDEVFIEVLLGGGPARVLFLHHWHKLSSDLIQLISGKQVGDFT